jgi:hypothetical protein
MPLGRLVRQVADKAQVCSPHWLCCSECLLSPHRVWRVLAAHVPVPPLLLVPAAAWEGFGEVLVAGASRGVVLTATPAVALQVGTQRSWKRPYGVGLIVAGVDESGELALLRWRPALCWWEHPHCQRASPQGSLHRNFKV